ncbi:MAG TPA: hypothetical protein VED87_01815, partial [Methylocystis sp.]|nr:hypothetical protein [Methylocystis sp.]
MSAPADRPLDSTDPFSYAPKRIREAAKGVQKLSELRPSKGPVKPVLADDSDDDSIEIPLFLNASAAPESPPPSPPSQVRRALSGFRAFVVVGIGLLVLGGAFTIWTAKANRYESAGGASSSA